MHVPVQHVVPWAQHAACVQHGVVSQQLPFVGTGQHGTIVGPRICGQTMEELPLAAGTDNAKTQIEATIKTSDDGAIKRRIAGTGG